MNSGRLISNLLLFVFLASQVTLAQVTTGTILGTVSDSTGAVVPGASVAVRNVETGISRTVTTDAAGRYRAAQLGLGNYAVTAEVAGFQTVVRSGITLTVGREATVDFTLQVGAVTERITVTGEAPLVETTSATVSSLVEGATVREMPLNGRSFDQLILLQPGASLITESRGGPPNWSGSSSRISVGGGRPTQSVTLLDGTNINGLFGQTGGGVGGNTLGVDAIREFRILTNNYQAEYGGTLGGVVNVVTLSGTNEFHGSAFEFLRNSSLDAKNYFDRKDRPIPAFKRNQFGGSLGGPIVRDRTFFFGVYEGLRERLGVTQVIFVPTMDARQGIGVVAGQTITVNPAVKPVLALYPVPNGPVIGSGIQQHTASATRPTNENFGQIRIDHQISSNHSLFGRYTQDRANTEDAHGGPDFLEFPRVSSSGNYYATAQWTSILSPTVLNTARIGFNRSGHRTLGPTEPNILRVEGIGTNLIGRLVVGSIVALGRGSSSTSAITVRNSFQYSDDLSISRGSHNFKLGALFNRFRDFFFLSYLMTPEWSFGNLQALLTNSPRSFRGGLTGADPATHWRQWAYAFYGQDDWRLTSRLTLNLGLRYEPLNQATSINGTFGDSIGVVEDYLHGVCCPVAKHPFKNNPTLKNLAPRFGFAWDIFGNGSTAVRGGFGMTYEPMQSHLYTFDAQFPPLNKNVEIFSPTFPNPFTRAIPQIFSGDEMTDYNTTASPSMMQFNLNLQRQFPGEIAFQIGYAGALGRHFGIGRDANYAFTTKFPDGRLGVLPQNFGVRRNPAYGALGFRFFEGNAAYNSLQISMQKSLSRGLMVSANYTWSKNTDDFSAIRSGESSTAKQDIQNPDCLSCEHSLSDFDRKHVANFNYSYALPIGPNRAIGGNLSGIAGKLLGGWEVSGISTINSGLPTSLTVSADRVANLWSTPSLTPIRPDLKSGSSNNPVEGVTAGCTGVPAGQKLSDPARWYDPCALTLQPQGVFGNVGRNTLIRPGRVNFDFSLIKNTRWGENYNLQFRAEFFNIFNHPNFGNPNNIVYTSLTSKVPSPTAGRITSTFGTSRQIQFGLKLTF